MKVVETVAALQEAVGEARRAGKSIGLVPTMGALHSGHLSLAGCACSQCDFVVVSIFVNPTQFNNPTDLQTYPRNLQADVALLQDNTQVDIVFAPSVQEVYPQTDTRTFYFGPLAEVMEGIYRPGHFNGVAQVVSKLFAFAQPDKAFFGEKDFQQLAIIRQMTKDLGLSITIVPCPIVREANGLAISSRNVLLSPEHKMIAPRIYEILQQSKLLIDSLSPLQTIDWVTREVNNTGLLSVEYFSICDGLTLQPIDQWNQTNYAVGCITVYAGSVRLIDNITYKNSAL